jgi:hypothetical protein
VFFGGLPEKEDPPFKFLEHEHASSDELFRQDCRSAKKGSPDGPVLPNVTDDLSWGRIVGCFRRLLGFVRQSAV